MAHCVEPEEQFVMATSNTDTTIVMDGSVEHMWLSLHCVIVESVHGSCKGKKSDWSAAVYNHF